MQTFENTVVTSKKNWLISQGYLQGIFWTVMCCLSSNVSDILMKSTGTHLKPFQIIFFRSFFGLIVITPFLIQKRNYRKALKTKNFNLHVNRTLFGAMAMVLACYSTTLLTLPEVTVVSFSHPLFLIPMAMIFLNEQLTFKRLLANIIGFIGILIALNIKQRGLFALATIVPLASAFLYTCQDMFTKKLTNVENPLTVVLYFNLGTVVLTGTIAAMTWTTPSQADLILLLLLGVSTTLIQVFSFMSFASANVIALAPLRYTELVFSCIFSILIFHEMPTMPALIGSVVIIGGVLYATRNEVKAIQP